MQDAGIPVFSEVEVAYRICRAPIVAISGTKGKTTTTSLVGHLLSKTGKPTHVGGNIGNPLIYETAKAAPNDWVVAEVSSFQLESIRSFKPRISLILNITPDHLDRYHSMDEYAERSSASSPIKVRATRSSATSTTNASVRLRAAKARGASSAVPCGSRSRRTATRRSTCATSRRSSTRRRPATRVRSRS